MKNRVVLLGGDTPLGREVRERLEAAVPDISVRLIGGAPDASDEEGGEEPTDTADLDTESLESGSVVVCACDAATAREAWEMAGGIGGPRFIDLSYALENLPEARLYSVFGKPAEDSTLYITAHPAASALALIVSRLQARYALRNVVAQIFEPASERGKAGVSELQKQVTSLLSFRPLDKKVFDAQAAFTMLGRYGEEAPEKLEDIEQRIERHIATLLAGAGPMPSMRLIQAPVFHGHTLSLWVEFDDRPDLEDVEADLESEHVEIRGLDVEPPNNVGVAGQAGITVGLLEKDRNNPRGLWLWAVADNYRVSADSAAAIVSKLLAGGE